MLSHTSSLCRRGGVAKWLKFANERQNEWRKTIDGIGAAFAAPNSYYKRKPIPIADENGLLTQLRENFGQDRCALDVYRVEQVGIESEGLDHGGCDLRGCGYGRDNLRFKAGIGDKHDHVGIVMGEATVVADHRRAAGVGHPYIGCDDNVGRARIIARLPSAL